MGPRFRGHDKLNQRSILAGSAMQAGEGFLGADALLRRTALLTLAATALVWVYAALELRPLFADGFHYFLRLLERENFWFEAPARRTVELIRQWPLLAALKLGAGDAEALMRLFGLSLLLVPLALVALCWPVLPRDRKYLFVFPLLHYVAGTAGAAFAPINEGATAAAYFWLLLFLLLFRAARPAGMALVAVLALGTVLLHEGMTLLAPLLAAAALWRARQATTGAPRSVFLALALWFAVVVAVEAYFIADPPHPHNREAYFKSLFLLWWLFGLWGSINWPALFGLVALAILGLLALWPRARFWPIYIALGAAAVAAVVSADVSDAMFAAQAQFNARNHPILISLPLGVAALWCAIRPDVARRLPFRPAVVLCALLAGVSALWHVEATRRWSDYVGVFRDVLRESRGLVAWEDVLARLPPARGRVFEGMSHFWIEPTMSIVLAPGGNVAAIVTARRAAGWYPFDATKPEQLPRSRFWNYDGYLKAR
jgi:hypothetical protein